ncbi:mucin-5B-like [Pyxicephalus adspersus]|uniref:mucin-5B-like n=1 Tax=Pyxicephalus adspersus TaxID=30357 RepID=UPI003B5B8F40
MSLIYRNCLFDTCSSKRAEDYLCAALSSYAWACASKGIVLSEWRKHACSSFTRFCPHTFVFRYNVTTCIPTCRSLRDPNSTSSITFFTVDGCVCPDGTYLNEESLCVKREDCPCYYKGFPVYDNEPLHAGRLICECKKGILHCTHIKIPECPPPKFYFDCDKAGEHARGVQCSQSCDATKPYCYSPLCVSGCLCPEGLLLNHNGTCIREEQCPCIYNGKHYKSGERTKIHCDDWYVLNLIYDNS